MATKLETRKTSTKAPFQHYPPNGSEVTSRFAEGGDASYAAEPAAFSSCVYGQNKAIFAHYWEPTASHSAATTTGIVFLHGVHEHSMRYAHVCEQLACAGMFIGAMDHFGHGRSEGDRGMFDVFASLVQDVTTFVAHCRARWGSRVSRIILWGQSWGGLIASHTALAMPPGQLDGLLLTSAAVDIEMSCTLKVQAGFGECISRVGPSLRVVAVVHPRDMSQSSIEVERYRNDPLNRVGNMSARNGAETLKAFKALAQRAAEICIPVLILHSPKDAVCSFEAARRLFETVSSTDKTFQQFDLFHTMLHEDKRQQVIDLMREWVLIRANSP
jgi:acylglycerol lipase